MKAGKPMEIILRLSKENKELKAWKESALSVTPDMQLIGKLLGVKLGDSIHDKIAPGIAKRNKAVLFIKQFVEFCENDRNRRRNTFYLDARRILKEIEG